MADKEYLDVVGFVVEGREGKRKPVTCGYAYRNDRGDLAIKLRSVPVGQWDGSLVVQKRQERTDGAPRGGGTPQRGGGYDDGDSIPF